MILGILAEKKQKRVSFIPENISKVSKSFDTIWVENNAGQLSYFNNEAYTNLGAIIKSREDILEKADVILCITPDLEAFKIINKKLVIGQFAPFENPNWDDYLSSIQYYPLSLDMIPRTSLAQSMDILSSMASIAGYKAVLKAASILPRYCPMMITAAGNIKPSRILVIGAGVAGLQAVATARKLGAVVFAMDTRAAVKEEVESLGAKFIVIPGASDDKGAGGYGVQQSEDFLANQRQVLKQECSLSDIIICTAQVRGKKAPLLIVKDTIETMKPGSVIIDLASSTGGNCEMSVDNETIIHNQITIIGNSALADEMPNDASRLYGNNIVNLLNFIIKDGQIDFKNENPIVKESILLKPQTN